MRAFSGFSADALTQYEAHFNRVDPWALALRPSDCSAGRVLDGREVVPQDVVQRGEYYADFGRVHGCLHAVFGFLEPVGPRVGIVTANRGLRRGSFDAASAQLLRTLLPHLQQTLRLRRRLATVDNGRAVACEALDRLPIGVVLVGLGGQPLFVNQAARGIADRRDGFTVGRNGIRGATPALTHRIAAAVSDATALSAGQFLA